MSRLHLLILWVLAIAAGIFYFKRKDVPQSIDSKTKLEIGSDLLPGETVETIDGFKIEDGDDTVTIKKVDGEWSVAELDNFPANLSTVTRVFEALRGTKVAQGVVASEEYYDRFDLDPEAEDEDLRPTRLVLISDGEAETTVFLGKTRTSTGGGAGGSNAGRFVRLSNDDSGIYVVSESFPFLQTEPENWIEKILTPLEEKAIKIEVTAPNDDAFNGWTVTRKTVLDDFELADLGEKEETKTAEANLLKTAFNRAPFIELVSQEDYEERADKKGIRQVKATDSAGSTFLITITPEKEKEPEEATDPSTPTPAINYLVSIEVLNGPTKPEPPAEDADVQEKAVFQERVANLADLSAAVNRMRRDYEGRYFLVNKSTVSAFLKNRGELVKPKTEEKDPVSVTTDPIEVPNPGNGNKPGLPGGGAGKPPASIARPDKPKVEAVTPPIRIPPVEEQKAPAPAEETEEKTPEPAQEEQESEKAEDPE